MPKKPPPGKWRLGADPDTTGTGSGFDEFVVDHWLHVEMMSARQCWLALGPLTLWVDLDKDGNATRVTLTDTDGWAESNHPDRTEWTPP